MTRCAQFAQVKDPVIDPAKGSEHLAQKGAVIRVALLLQAAQRYSCGLTASVQTEQSDG
ncbi:MAG: hypothetical protein ABI795_06250 [Chthoniobacterales bacterium]